MQHFSGAAPHVCLPYDTSLSNGLGIMIQHKLLSTVQKENDMLLEPVM